MGLTHIKTTKDYKQYQERVDRFFTREGILDLSLIDNEEESYFSWHVCDMCDRSLGGDRYNCSGYNPITDEVYEYSVCTDCIYYATYGHLDDQTMMDLEDYKNAREAEGMTPLQKSQEKWRRILSVVQEWEGAPIYEVPSPSCKSIYHRSYIIAGEWIDISSKTCALCQEFTCNDCPVLLPFGDDDWEDHEGCINTPFEDASNAFTNSSFVDYRIIDAVGRECEFLDSLEDPDA